MQVKTNSGNILTLQKDGNGYWILNEKYGNSYISDLYLRVYMKAANWTIVDSDEQEEEADELL